MDGASLLFFLDEIWKMAIILTPHGCYYSDTTIAIATLPKWVAVDIVRPGLL